MDWLRKNGRNSIQGQGARHKSVLRMNRIYYKECLDGNAMWNMMKVANPPAGGLASLKKQLHYMQRFFLLLTILFLQCKAKKEMPAGDPDNGGLFLPGNFEALVVADSIGLPVILLLMTMVIFMSNCDFQRWEMEEM